MRDIKVSQVGTSWQLVNPSKGNILIQVMEGSVNYFSTPSLSVPSVSEEGQSLGRLNYRTISGFTWVRASTTGRILTAVFDSPGEQILFEGLYTSLQQSFIFNENQGQGDVEALIAAAIATHESDTDPHGDRAYFDGYINDFLIPGLAAKAAVESPAFAGEPTAPTAPLNNNSNIIANTAFVQQALANVLTGVWKDQGNFDASSGAWPTSANTIDLGTPLAGYLWKVSVGGTLAGGIVVNVGDIIRALVDNPSNSATDWAATESNLGYVPENQANKQTSLASPNNTTFPTTQAVANALASLLSAAALRYTFNPQPGTSYSVAAADVTSTGTVIVICANSSPVAVTLATPTALLGGIAADHAGKSTNIRQGGSGIVTVTGSLVGNGVFSAQHETKTFIAQADNTWLVVGG